jgi:hypothetical protein
LAGEKGEKGKRKAKEIVTFPPGRNWSIVK